MNFQSGTCREADLSGVMRALNMDRLEGWNAAKPDQIINVFFDRLREHAEDDRYRAYEIIMLHDELSYRISDMLGLCYMIRLILSYDAYEMSGSLC